MSKSKLFPLVLVSVMSALGTVIYMVFPEIPLVPGVEYLKVDLSDIPALVTGMTIGPSFGIIVEVFKNLIHLTRTTTFGIGEIMNIGIGSFMVFSMWGGTRVWSRMTRKGASDPLVYYSASATTILLTIVVGWILNAIFTPIFYSIAGFPMTLEILMAGIWGSTVLNAVKCAVTVLPFWPLIRVMQKVAKKLS